MITRNCQICNNSYQYCPDCEKNHSYRTVVDTPVCYKIYMVLYELRMNIIDKQKAKLELNTIGITERNIDKFHLTESIKNTVLDILKTETDSNTESISETKTVERKIKNK